MDAITIRPAEPAEPDAVAGLRWQWIQEDEGEPVGTREEFVRHFADWARENAGSHRLVPLIDA